MRPTIVLVAVLLAALTCFAQQSADEQAVWKLEHAYWTYVSSMDLEKYMELWHPNFVGWSFAGAQPVRKDHITDWITAYKSKGLQLKSYTLEPAASQATENIVVTHYWLTSLWVDKDGRGEPSTIRVTHTWIRTAGGWQIIGGMAAPATRPAK
ncbi:MAG: nuclear transport factor 2 family protein [Candidatus Acidiferrales bacterium]